MAAPTSKNEVTVRKLTKLIYGDGTSSNTGLWGKIKSLFLKKADAGTLTETLNLLDYFSYDDESESWTCTSIPPLVDYIITQGRNVTLLYQDKYYSLHYAAYSSWDDYGSAQLRFTLSEQKGYYTYGSWLNHQEISINISNYGAARSDFSVYFNDVDLAKKVHTHTPEECSAMPASPSSGDYNGNANRAWCIKLTRTALTNTRSFIHFSVDVARGASSSGFDDFGSVEIYFKCVKSSDSNVNTWYATAYANRRCDAAKRFLQCFVYDPNDSFISSTGGTLYIGITSQAWSSIASPRVVCDRSNGQFTYEFGDFHTLVDEASMSTMNTRFPVYTQPGNADKAAIGSVTVPVYADADGQLKQCSLPIASTSSSGYMSYLDKIYLSKSVNASSYASYESGHQFNLVTSSLVLNYTNLTTDAPNIFCVVNGQALTCKNNSSSSVQYNYNLQGRHYVRTVAAGSTEILVCSGNTDCSGIIILFRTAIAQGYQLYIFRG